MLEAQFADRLAKTGVGMAPELTREIWLFSEGAISLMLVHGDRAYAAAAPGGRRREPDLEPSSPHPQQASPGAWASRLGQDMVGRHRRPAKRDNAMALEGAPH